MAAFGFILAALRANRYPGNDASRALWVPFIWMFLIGTRYLSQWLSAGGSLSHPDEYLEGSPLDQVVFSALLVIGLTILGKRRVRISQILKANTWMLLFLIYGMISVVWSDYPWTAAKRFVKVAEHTVMVLIVLTDKNPKQAIDTLLRQFSIVCIVISVTFLKYFPELSRAFDNWTGQPFNTGIATDKNALGHICLIGSLLLVSSWVSDSHRSLREFTRSILLIDVILMLAIVWLLDMANAKTALVCSLLGIVVIVILTRTRLGRNPRLFVLITASVVGLGFALESMFQLREAGFEALGRDATLTDRVYVWVDVLAVDINPLIGTGFESFWLGPRAEKFWEKYWWHPNQAHNGYIETYINLGIIGLTLLCVTILQAIIRILRSLPLQSPFAPLRLAFLVSILVFNYTDATFKALHILYFVFFLCAIIVPQSPIEGERPLKPA